MTGVAWLFRQGAVLSAWFVLMPWGDQRSQDVAGCVVSFGLLVFTFLAWSSAVFRPTSSTAALIFLFLPIYSVVGGAILWPLLYATMKARGRSTP